MTMNVNIQKPQTVARKRSGVIRHETSRVLTRLYIPGQESRVKSVINRVIGLDDEQVKQLLDRVLREFSSRHRHLKESLERHYKSVEHLVPRSESVSPDRRLLLGAYFTNEYSVEAAALFNPSIVIHPNQRDVPGDGTRFIMSFRATGEGHISSIEFRSGVIDKDNGVFFDPVSNYIETPELRVNRKYDKRLLNLKLNEMGACDDVTARLFNKLSDEFTFDDMVDAIAKLDSELDLDPDRRSRAAGMAMWLVRSNYIVRFRADHRISERVIFPVSENESKGIEDARFVRFTDDDGAVIYYATYTAYNGSTIIPQLIETKDFVTFRVITLNGKAVQNKGMALFPRKINGQYVMLSRQDGENNQIMFSENIHFWQESQILRAPARPWEFVQIGNCGSPIETPAGWLLVTHGVGPMRKYSIGVDLLDLHDPGKVIGSLDKPIIEPTDEDREGYVPNVVYSCGCIIHNGELIIPYASADQRSSVATMPVDALLEYLKV